MMARGLPRRKTELDGDVLLNTESDGREVVEQSIRVEIKLHVGQ
jgi:hypothetical protein